MTVLKQICAVFYGNLPVCDLQINHKNLQICYLQSGMTTPKKFAVLQ